MAEKATDDGKKKGRTKAKGKGGDANGGMGHNLTEIRKVLEPGFKALFALQDEMESTMGEFKVDFKNKYEEIANKSGCARSILRKEFRRALAKRREEQEEREMEASERDQIETLRAALDGTPFGAWVAGELAKGAGGATA